MALTPMLKPDSHCQPNLIINECHPLALIEMGSNRLRLFIYKELGRVLVPLYQTSAACSLGEDISETKVFSVEIQENTLKVLAYFKEIAQKYKASKTLVIGTEALRKAQNKESFLKRVSKELGLSLQVLEGCDEAFYSALGVRSTFYKASGIVIDLGGGSLELATLKEGNIIKKESFPLGVIPLTKHLKNEGGERIEHFISQNLKEAKSLREKKLSFYLLGGTLRVIGKLHMRSQNSPFSSIHGYNMAGEDLQSFTNKLKSEPSIFFKEFKGLSEKRKRYLPAAGYLLNYLLKKTSPTEVYFSGYGLREGFLYSQLSNAVKEEDALFASIRAFQSDNHFEILRAPSLFKWMSSLFQEKSEGEQRLLYAACLLSDVSWLEHPEYRALHSLRLLLNFPLVGVSHKERSFLALCLWHRYNGRGYKTTIERLTSLLGPLADNAYQVGLTLRLCHLISNGILERLFDSQIKIEGKSLLLKTRALPNFAFEECEKLLVKLARIFKLKAVLEVEA